MFWLDRKTSVLSFEMTGIDNENISLVGYVK